MKPDIHMIECIDGLFQELELRLDKSGVQQADINVLLFKCGIEHTALDRLYDNYEEVETRLHSYLTELLGE